MNKYELTVVVNAKIEDDVRVATVEKVKEFMGEYEEKQIKEDIAIQKAVDVIVNSVVEK